MNKKKKRIKKNNKIIKNLKNLRRARTREHTITERPLKPLGHL